MSKKVRIHHFKEMKQRGEKITMLTAYDYPTAKAFDAAGVDMLLVGDSLADNILGYESTGPVTLDEMIPFARAVARGAERAFVVADLPFGSYEVSPEQAVESSVRMMKLSGAQAVKFEGGCRVARQAKAVTDAGIPFCGHLGFTPQSENALGGHRVQGRGEQGVKDLIDDALALQEAGAFAVVLEMVAAPAARAVTEALEIPTIGIGAGSSTDGQVLVWLDMAGVGDWHPRFSRQFGAVGAAMTDAAAGYVKAVKDVAFPAAEHTFES